MIPIRLGEFLNILCTVAVEAYITHFPRSANLKKNFFVGEGTALPHMSHFPLALVSSSFS